MIQALIAAIALVLALISPVQAADISAAQGQTSTVSGQSYAGIESGAVNVISNGSPELPYKVIESKGTTTVKNVGGLVAPGIVNSSGGYNCSGGVSAGLAVPGGSATFGSTTEGKACPGFHRMDKAAGRANAAAKQVALYEERMAATKDQKLIDKYDALRIAAYEQVEAWSRVWDAEYCAMEDGATAMKKAGLKCPDADAAERQAEKQAAARRPFEAP